MKKTGFVIVLSLICAVAMLGCSAVPGKTAPASSSYQNVSVTKGDITQTVTAPGVLKFVDPVHQKAAANVKITDVSVKVGDTVKKGDIIASYDATALSAEISRLYTSLTQLRQQEQGYARSFRSGRMLIAGVRGRVKEIYIQEGDAINTVVAAKGGIMLISADGLMTVQLQAAGVAVNDEVKVVFGTYDYTGYVSRIDGGTVTVSFTDARALPGETVEVYYKEKLLGTGAAQIDLPYLIPADAGTVTDVYVKVNDSVAPIQPVANAKYMPVSDNYRAVLDQLAQAQRDLDAAKALQAQGAILAEQDGVVASVLPEGTYPNGTKLMDIYPQGQFECTISVDELDIFSIVVGQSATVQFDGVPDKTFDAAVTKISSVGQVANGFTTYAVTLRVTDDGTLKSGLNGTVSIVVNQRTGVLILPVEAISEDGSGSYVTLIGSPQAKTPVVVGISDGRSIEIVSGLSEGDTVAIRAAADIMSGTR